MNQFITGSTIKRVRESNHITQTELAEMLGVSDKTISKWETGKGYPDITLIEPLAQALNISVIELLSGKDVTNTNLSLNMRKIHFFVCPICGNVITAIGETVVCCCGVVLSPLEAEASDEMHSINIEQSEDEYYVTVDHEMSKEHYISFIASVKDNSIELTKLYPESPAEVRFKTSRSRSIYYYCNKHGLFYQHIHK